MSNWRQSDQRQIISTYQNMHSAPILPNYFDLIGTDSSGNVYVVTPKNKTEAKKMEREIKKTGTLAGAEYRRTNTSAPGSPPWRVEDSPTTLYGPDNKLLKKAANVSTSRRQRKSGQ